MKQHEVTTVALTEAFLQLDAALSRAQIAVGNYYSATGDHSIDLSWNAVLTRCEEATTSYLAMTAPDNEVPLRQHGVDWGIQLIQSAIKGIETFQHHYEQPLHDAVNTLARRAAEAQRLQEESARRAQEKAVEAEKALSSVSTRLEMARRRLTEVPAALSTLHREFPVASWEDLVDNEPAARTHIATAADCLGLARSAPHSDPEEVLNLARHIRCALTVAEQLIGAVLDRLQRLRELRTQPERPLDRVRFALHDAQMFCVSHGLTKQWASVLDAQLVRIETLEASVKTHNPDYWAYTNGLDKVNDFIQSVVVKMRQDIRK